MSIHTGQLMIKVLRDKERCIKVFKLCLNNFAWREKFATDFWRRNAIIGWKKAIKNFSRPRKVSLVISNRICYRQNSTFLCCSGRRGAATDIAIDAKRGAVFTQNSSLKSALSEDVILEITSTESLHMVSNFCIFRWDSFVTAHHCVRRRTERPV